ncbi:MAG: lysophospholipid acyltransferase family protein [Bacteroidota bacterium]
MPDASTTSLSVASRLWFAWTMLVYLVVSPVFWAIWMPVMILRPTVGVFWRWFRVYDRIVYALCGFRIRSVREGASGDKVGPAVYVSNHQAMMDIPALALAIDTPFVFVARGSLRKVPLVGSVLHRSPCVFIDRNAPGGAQEALTESTERLRDGISVLFFPEGTRSFTGELLPFRRGAFQVALDADVPVVPVALGDTHHLLDERSRTARPGRLEVRIGPPMYAEPGEAPEAFAARAQAEVQRLLALARA